MTVYDELQARGASIVGISRDTAEQSQGFAERIGIEFPLLSDPDLAIAKDYGVADPEVAIPAVFVIRQDGSMAWSYIGERMSDRPASQMVIEALDAIETGG